ncbi:MAG: YidC/Oxa1 family rane protein insertase [Blastocatellia bacterium]|jgi:YidC/Oxa1 family membrane protein insertase|nr:YidC/Oxa1 family rane protein insertase [Blastocatellia bacterium]
MRQERFIIALVLSAAILFGWTYFFPTKTPQQQANSNTAGAPQPGATPQPTAQAAATPAPVAVATPPSQDNTPHRRVHVMTPLYKVTLDSQGAVATSWIIQKNRNTGKDLLSAASTKGNPKPLELIPSAPPDVKPEQFVRPLLAITGDQAVDSALGQKNFKITGADNEDAESTLNVPTGSRQIQLALHDDATALDATKTITFFADRYVVDVTVEVKRSGQVTPTKLAVGPNIGDQGVGHYTFYTVAPEGVSSTEGQVHRIYATAVHSNAAGWFSDKRPEGQDLQNVGGAVDWAGVGDTYFTMVALPMDKAYGLEFKTVAYQHDAAGKKEERYLITAFVPLPANGKAVLYAGPKDHQLLFNESGQISQQLGRTIDLDGVVNYGRLSKITKPLSSPILWSIKKLQALTGSYGVAIILFTILIYSLFFPLKWQSSRKMKKAQKYAPRMKELQEKIKGMKQNDPRLKELQVEQLRLMKEANPLGGCLPLLIQMPFLFALYTAITVSIDFRQASFLWIPDLSGGDPTHVLEVLMAGSMIVLQLITPAPSADPLQRKMMAIGMPLFMLYILWGAPAGLLVYWLVGNIVGFSQQLIINRLTKSEDDEQPPASSKAKSGGAKKLNPARV